MADVYMHAKLAKEILQSHKQTLNSDLVLLGAQGPDPMYYGFIHKYHKDYRFFADRMHDTDTNKLFEVMFSYVKEHPSLDVYSYVIGFLCHFALDVNIHPYVYHHVGQYDELDVKTHHMRGLHLKFERSIDAMLIEHDTDYKAHRYPLQREAFPKKNLPSDLQKFYQDLMEKRYQFSDGAVMIKNSVQSMYRVLRYIVQDRTGLKKLGYKVLDRIFSKEDMYFSDLSMYHHVTDFDFLNQEHRKWTHPVTEEPSKKSVLELYQDATLFAKELIGYFDQYLAGEETEKISSIIQNVSFNSGVGCDDTRLMKHYNIYLK